jgi:hypothetical protein
MKKVIFSALWLLLIAATGCNDQDKTKENTNNNIAMGDPSARQPNGMIDTLGQAFPIFSGSKYNKDSLKELVKFDYTAFKNTIGNAKEVYLVYGALTSNDTVRYLATHTVDPSEHDSFCNRPCLLVYYKDASGKFTYSDFGSLCPPPYSCASYFMNHTGTGPVIPPLDPTATTKNYFTKYDTSKTNPLTTTMVKFDVALLERYVDSLNKEKPKGIASNIYFQMAAHNNASTDMYLSNNSTASRAQILGKPCLLFVYKNADPASMRYLDFGVVCPPGQ